MGGAKRPLSLSELLIGMLPVQEVRERERVGRMTSTEARWTNRRASTGIDAPTSAAPARLSTAPPFWSFSPLFPSPSTFVDFSAVVVSVAAAAVVQSVRLNERLVLSELCCSV